jgi:hypothetical protein
MSSLVHQLLIREVNARIRELDDRHGAFEQTYVLLCECGRPLCHERVEVPVAVYRAARAGDAVLVAAGHGGPVGKPEVGLEPTTSALQERCSAS